MTASIESEPPPDRRSSDLVIETLRREFPHVDDPACEVLVESLEDDKKWRARSLRVEKILALLIC
jgi:hypothetical protein